MLIVFGSVCVVCFFLPCGMSKLSLFFSLIRGKVVPSVSHCANDDDDDDSPVAALQCNVNVIATQIRCVCFPVDLHFFN